MLIQSNNNAYSIALRTLEINGISPDYTPQEAELHDIAVNCLKKLKDIYQESGRVKFRCGLQNFDITPKQYTELMNSLPSDYFNKLVEFGCNPDETLVKPPKKEKKARPVSWPAPSLGSFIHSTKP